MIDNISHKLKRDARDAQRAMKVERQLFFRKYELQRYREMYKFDETKKISNR